jgi:phosphopentomutase
MVPFVKKTGLNYLWNKPASGSEIIKQLGIEHMKTSKLIVYTSADSVFQIAAHEQVIPLEKLYNYCEIARDILQGKHAVGRVIARPFIGQGPEDFTRTKNRKDFSLAPSGTTILDILVDNNFQTIGVGKIGDIFAYRGLTRTIKTNNNEQGIDVTIGLLREDFSGLIFTNLVDFDMLYGHRNDVKGYARAIEDFDKRLPELINSLGSNDILILTSDHGCDPTTISTDHSREYIPILVYGSSVKRGIDLGIRSTFSDIGATVLDLFGIGPLVKGRSFVDMIYERSN